MGKKRRRSSMAERLQQKEKEGISNTMLNPTAMYLEKMGGELKCPICLSLLNQAASLTCNHAFCNACILRSMKSASVCPVCKVPCSRREVRPAPHMDSLVNIYKSMEVAAGINIFVSQPSIAKDARDHQDKENVTPCRNDLKRKPPVQTEVKRKKIKERGPKPSRFSVVSSHEVQENDQVIPSPHQPVKHSFPTKKRVQVSLYPPEHKTGTVAMSSVKDPPLSDRVKLDNLGNPLLSPFFWLRDHESGEADCVQLPASQPTQVTQITQGSPFEHPSFSDLKDSDDEGYHQELQSDEGDTGVIIPDTFDSEVFEWTKKPCSSELTSSSRKQQTTKESETDIEGAFGAYPCPSESIVADTVNGSNLERNQALDAVANETLTCATIETGGVLKKRSGKEKVKNINSDEKARLERKTNGKIVFEARREANNIKTIGKKSRRISARSNGRNLMNEVISPVGDSVACSSAERSPHDSNKELDCKTDDIFNVMFGLSANGFATDTAAAKPQSCSELKRQEHQNLPDSYFNASKQDQLHSSVNLTQECSHSNDSVDCGSNLGQTTEADSFKIQPQASGNGCVSEAITAKSEVICAFCRTSGNSEGAGEMMHYSNGRPLPEHKEMTSNVVHVHEICAEWAPDVYFKGDCIMNLEEEVARGVKIKCSMCGLKGAALGCCLTKCHKSFHVPCALSSPDCKWDIDNFVMLCPTHSCQKFPKESKTPKSSKRDKTPSSREQRSSINGTPHRGGPSTAATRQALAGSDPSQPWTWSSGPSSKWVLCGSALDTVQKEQLINFANLVGATISKTWSPTVTHVVASTDANGACKRTLKFLMAVLEGKWVLRADWIAACIKAGHPVNEELFQITHDIHDTHEGPKRGRERVEKKAPRLFEGLSFYLSGVFASSMKGYLQDLISAAGGLVLHRKPIMDQPDCYHTIVLYNVELPQTGKHGDKEKLVQRRLDEAKSLAHTFRSQFAAHTWVLESIAACQLEPVCNKNGYN